MGPMPETQAGQFLGGTQANCAIPFPVFQSGVPVANFIVRKGSGDSTTTAVVNDMGNILLAASVRE